MIPLTAKKHKKEEELLEQVVNLLKEHPIVLRLFDKFGVDIDHIHEIPIEFTDLDVSAKAKNGKIYLNKAFLEDGNIVDDLHYLIHEITHILQNHTGNVHEHGGNGDHYLDDPAEIEAFKEQIRFIEDYKGDNEANQYVNDLLDFHEFKGNERDKKHRQLRG